MASGEHKISTVSYFESATDDEMDYLIRHSVLRTYKTGEILFHEGDPAEGLWLVETGHVKIYKLSPDGDEHILHLSGPGTTFNDIPALENGGDNPANAAALSADTRLWLIPTEAITYILNRNPQVAVKVIRMLAKRVRSLVGQIEDLALYSVIVRLARFLLKQVDDPSLSGPGVTRTTIAGHLNTTPQTISVALRELESAGAIEFDRHRITIIDEEKLQTIAML